MALGYTPQEKFDLLKTLCELMGLLQELQKDPTLVSASKNAFALSDKEKAKAEEARGAISKYEGLVAENKKQLAEIASGKAAIDTERKSIEKQNQEIAAVRAANESRTRQLDAVAAEHANTKRQLDNDREALTVKERIHQQNVQNLAERQKEVDAFEEKLKKAAARIKENTEGL